MNGTGEDLQEQIEKLADLIESTGANDISLSPDDISDTVGPSNYIKPVPGIAVFDKNIQN
jgi:hypothetical protein